MASENKTQPTSASVEDFLAAIDGGEQQRDCRDTNNLRQRDCRDIDSLMRTVSGCEPVMWGTSIVGYGLYHYAYESGRRGRCFRIGFSPRKRALTIYIMPGYTDYSAILAELGKYRTGRSCLYIKRLSDVSRTVLARLLAAGWQDMERLYPLDQK